MTITEKAAYLKGLVEGKGLDPEAGEGKLWHVLAELVGDMASELGALREEHETMSDQLEEVEVGLDYLEELLQEDYDDDLEDFDNDEEDNYYPFGDGNFRVVDDDEDDREDDDTDEVFYEVECPNCGEEISFDDETLEAGSIRCPSCGATLEFDMSGPGEDPDGDAPGVQDDDPQSGEDDT